MKYINIVLIFILSTFFSCFNQNKKDISQARPEYRLLHRCSEKIRQDNQLVLRRYGVNLDKPIEYKIKNNTYNFSVSYNLYKNQNDTISIEMARNLIISVVECISKEINSDPEMKSRLDFFPITSDLIRVSIYITDENEIELGKGVSYVYLNRNKLKYEGYNISEYRSHPPAIGKHYTILEETYEEALEAVKKTSPSFDISSKSEI